ncbi:MAG: UvrD-helicase domain-containing protein, partial [Muribaculaceae bacterium]|nr:UvrD-helicase domain-containing protein [Muribaculaceae bacterium]
MLRNLTVYKASAGSGKTFRLAYEFIKHQLGYRDEATGRYRLAVAGNQHRNRHRAILAITFTNKATEEMKRRIVRELAVLAGAPLVAHRKSDYASMLTAEFGCTDQELRITARQALTDLLYDFNFFNVSTIDAFFQNVLRVFAREAELNGNYEVELNDDFAIETGVDSMLSTVTKEYGSGESLSPQLRQLASWLHRYMIAQIDEGQAFNLFNRTSSLRNRLVSFIKSLTGEDFKYNEKAIREYIDDPGRMERFERELMQLRRDTRDTITSNSTKIFTLIASNGYPESYLERGINTLLYTWASGGTKSLTDAQRARIDADPPKRYYAAIAKAGLIDSHIDSLVVETMRAIDHHDELDIVAAQIYSLGLFGHVLRHINEFRHDNNLILLSDTNNLLREIIGDNATPFVYERVGLWLRHFLIDEFQDTSSLQWDNLRPLVETSLAEANDNLIIGDEKQCIYRFRNSDPSLLRSKIEAHFPGRVKLEGDTAESNTNYRSSREVVEFNNTLFTRMATGLGIGDLYRNVVQNVSPGAPSGYVLMQGVRGDDGTKASFVDSALALTAREIARQLASGYSQSDIAILVRSNSEADTVIDYLLTKAKETPGLEHLQVLSDDALTIESCSAVRLIVNDLKQMDTMLTTTSSGRYTSMADYHRIVRDFDSLRNSGMSASDALAGAVARFMEQDNDRHQPDNIPTGEEPDTGTSLYAIVEHLIAGLANEVRQRDNVFLSAFQDLVLDFSSRGQADIYSFLRWWESTGHKACLASAPGLDAIRVMTIHKSKGLEFPCVHIPLAGGPLMSDDKLRWYPADGLRGFSEGTVPPMLPLRTSRALANTSFAATYSEVLRDSLIDELNVLYVAFTRAVNELIVFFRPAAKSSDSHPAGYHLAIATDADPANPLYVSGSPTVKTSGTAKTIQPDEPTPADIAGYTPGIRDGLLRLTEVDHQSGFDDPRHKGNMLHKALASVRHRRDIPVAVRRLAARGSIPRDQT